MRYGGWGGWEGEICEGARRIEHTARRGLVGRHQRLSGTEGFCEHDTLSVRRATHSIGRSKAPSGYLPRVDVSPIRQSVGTTA